MNGTTAYVLSKRKLKQSLNGLGAISGAPAQIDSIIKVIGGNQVKFKWQGNDGSIQYSTMTVLDGVSTVNAEFREMNNTAHLIFIMSDDSEIDAGIIPMGNASSEFTIDNKTGQLLYRGLEINVARTNGYSIQTVTLEEYDQLIADNNFDKKTVYIIENDHTGDDAGSCGFSVDENNKLMYNGVYVDAATVNNFTIRRITKEEYVKLKETDTADHNCIYIIDNDNTSDIDNGGFYLDENNQLMHDGKYVDVATVNKFTIKRITKSEYDELKSTGNASPNCIYLIDDDETCSDNFSIKRITQEEYDILKENGTADHNCIYIIDDDNSVDMESSGFYLNEDNQLMYNGISVDAATVEKFSIQRVTKETYLEMKENGTADPDCIYLIDDDAGENVFT